MARGQRKGFQHTDETKRVIGEVSRGAGKGGFNVKVPCPNCQVDMSPANLSHHLPQCLKYKGRIKEVKTLRIQLRPLGLTVEQFEHMVAQQNGVCFLCGSDPTKSRLSVDHNHQTHRVRKLLCNPCNMVLGLVKESPDVLRKMADYLESYED